MVKIIKIIVLNLFLLNNIYANSKLILEKYSNIIPYDVKVNIKNNESEPEFLNYIFIKAIDAPVRVKPTIKSKEIIRLPFNTKLKALEKIEVNKNEWYKVEIVRIDGKKEIGYISSNFTFLRKFRFDIMNSKVLQLETFLKEESQNKKELISTNTYIPNPTN